MKPEAEKQTEKGVVFFIDKQQFKTEQIHLSVRTLLADFAKEDPSQTTLKLKEGNEIKEFNNLAQVIDLKNGMKFLVYHNGPTTVS